MREDVFSAALKATARVAFSMALVGGCSSAEDAPAESNDAAIKLTDKPNVGKKHKPGTQDAGAVAYDASAAPPDAGAPPTCSEQLDALSAAKDKWWADLNAYYEDGGTSDGAAPPAPVVSAATKQCCHDELISDGYKAAHRDACCELAYTWEESVKIGGAISAACTPWGPPVPPAMTRETVLA